MTPTAEEFFNERAKECGFGNWTQIIVEQEWEFIELFPIEFAKLHVEEALKEAIEKAALESRLYSKFQGKIEKTENLGQEINLEEQLYIGINKDSILNAYPLTLIK